MDEVKNVYEMVDENEYIDEVNKKRDSEWIVDDDGGMKWTPPPGPPHFSIIFKNVYTSIKIKLSVQFDHNGFP